MPTPPWPQLAAALTGELRTDSAALMLYATDASVYRQVPQAVAFPRSEADVVACVRFAARYGTPITPRAGGTSLAGQAVGAGLVVDVSKHLRGILHIDPAAGYAVVEPGVVRDQLNATLAPLGYWFGPNTSTANRCTLGGMFGNNSCGSTSITVGSTREHVLGARVVLSDATVHNFGARTQVPGSSEKSKAEGTEPQEEAGTGSRVRADVAQFLNRRLTDPATRAAIVRAFPKRSVSRRNTGYALDLLAEQQPYTPDGPPANLCTLLAGSEGTLGFTTRLTVRILPLPPAGTAVLCLHYRSVDAAMRATQHVMAHRPFMCEMMDDTILQLAQQNPDQRRNAAFVDGVPRALLLVEFRAEDDAAAAARAAEVARLLATDAVPAAYAAPVLAGAENSRMIWALRAAGLGILGNMVGDAKAVACIEDTAVALDDLADYIAEVEALMHLYQQNPVYYAHAGAGEIHLRPILNLKTTAGREDFFRITRDVAALVKKYRGSLSGEHGDGRVRAAFLPDMLGPEVYGLLVELKHAFDPAGVFNPGKITAAPPMNEGLRYEADAPTPAYATALDWSADGGLLPAIEKCNGSGDCRKMSGGAMCPSYRATRSEQHTTRGRANVLREVLTQAQAGELPFDHPDLAATLDLCLSCKACTSECPSSVDMTNLKAEYLHQRGRPSLRTRLIAANEHLYAWGGRFPRLANLGLRVAGPLVKRLAGVAAARSLPPFPDQSLRRWFAGLPEVAAPRGEVLLFGDEFVNLQDVAVGRATVRLLRRLGYRVVWPDHATSGRAQLSKGLLTAARRRAATNVATFAPLASAERPVVGVEPSAVLGFRDEYPKLLRDRAAADARTLAPLTFTLDEFLHREMTAGRLRPDDFGPARRELVLHVHCHEKALGEAGKCALALALPPNFSVRLLNSGCCGMAGSFGYEAEHYALSTEIAEESLLRHLRPLPEDTVVVASGTSCRHQVKDLLGRRALSTAEALLLSWPTR